MTIEHGKASRENAQNNWEETGGVEAKGYEKNK